MPGPGMAVYHATKAYVLSFSEALHRELKPHGVRVTALCPGPVETEFQARAGMPEGYFPRMLSRSAERVAHEGYDGLMRNRRVVVPGSDNKVAALLPRLLPRGADAVDGARKPREAKPSARHPARQRSTDASQPSAARYSSRPAAKRCQHPAAAPRPVLDRHRAAHQHQVS